MFLLGKISQWFDTEWGGVFQLESCEEFQAFSCNHFAKIPRKKLLAKLFFQIGHFAPNSFAHSLNSTIVEVVKL